MASSNEAAQAGVEPLIERLTFGVAATAHEAQEARSVAEDVSRREADDRSWIARWIIRIFVGLLGIVFAILVAGAFRTGDWATAATQSTDLIKSAVLPVVTLVLGYHFGRSGKG
jgi:hypothetical protein